MKRALVLVSLLAFSAHAADPVPADAPRLDGTVKLCDPKVEENVARYVLKLEIENADLHKHHIGPVHVVLIAAAGLLLGVGLGAGIALAGQPAPPKP